MRILQVLSNVRLPAASLSDAADLQVESWAYASLTGVNTGPCILGDTDCDGDPGGTSAALLAQGEGAAIGPSS